MATIAVFVGSVRSGRQGRKVADWVASSLSARGHTVHLIDPLEYEELLSLKQMFKSMKDPSDDMKLVRKWVVDSDGVVAITPEYNHAFSGALKNAMDHFLEEFYFKPAAIVTYSAGGFGGIRAAEHLRAVLPEMGMPTIPISLPISKVHNVFDESGALVDEGYTPRLAKMLDEFEWYIRAFVAERNKGTPY